MRDIAYIQRQGYSLHSYRKTPAGPALSHALAQISVVALSLPRAVQMPGKHRKEFPRQARAGRTRPQAMVHPAPIPPCFHQTHGSQEPQMPRDGVLGHAQGIHQFADTELPVLQETHQAEAGRIAEGLQEANRFIQGNPR